MTTIRFLVVVVVLVVTVIAFTPAADAASMVPRATVPVLADRNVAAVAGLPCEPKTLLVVVILIDGTESMRVATSRRPTHDDLEQVVAYGSRCGMDLAVGAIREVPSSLEQLSLVQVSSRGQPPGTERNSNLLDALEKKRRAIETEAQRRREADERQQEIGEFLGRLQLIVEPKDLARRTDLVRQLNVAETFLMQPRVTNGRTVRRIAIIYSDAQQTVLPRTSRRLPPEVAVYLINSLDAGNLAGTTLARMTDFRSAFHAAVGGVR